MHCLKLWTHWPPEANSCRSCNMFMHLLNQIIRGFIWKHLSTLHKLSKNKLPFDAGKQTQKACDKKETWMIVILPFQSGSVGIWSVWMIKSLYIHGPCLRYPSVIKWYETWCSKGEEAGIELFLFFPFLQFEPEDLGMYVLFPGCEWVHYILFFTKILTIRNGAEFSPSFPLPFPPNSKKKKDLSCSKTVASTTAQL